jgi:GcrA cell cycle regulator
MPTYTGATNDVWTKDRVEVLTSMWLVGRSAGEIMRALGAGITRNAVVSKVHRLKLPSHGPATTRKPRAPKVDKPKKSGGGGFAFAVARARKAAAAGEPVVSAAEAILGTGTQGASKFTDPYPTIVDEQKVISLVELTERTCKWPIGDPLEPGFGFCGQPPIEGKPYCQRHHDRGTVPVRVRDVA